MTKQTRVTTDTEGPGMRRGHEPRSFVVVPASALDPDGTDRPREAELEALDALREHLRGLGIPGDPETAPGARSYRTAVDPRERDPVALVDILDGTLELDDGSEHDVRDVLSAPLNVGADARTTLAELLDRPCELRESDAESWQPLAPYQGITIDLDSGSVTVGDVLEGSIDFGDGRTLGVREDLWTDLLWLPGGHLATLSEVYELTPVPSASDPVTFADLESEARLAVGTPDGELTLRTLFREGSFELPSGESLRIRDVLAEPMDDLGLSITLAEIFDVPVEVVPGEVVVPSELFRTVAVEPTEGRTVEKLLHTPIHLDGGRSTTLDDVLGTEFFVRAGSAERPAYEVIEGLVGWKAHDDEDVDPGWRFEDCLDREIEPAMDGTITAWDLLREVLPVEGREAATSLFEEVLNTPAMLPWADGEVQPAWLIPGYPDPAATHLTLRAAFGASVGTESDESVTARELLRRPLDVGVEPRTVEEIIGLSLGLDDGEFAVAHLLTLPVNVEIRSSSRVDGALDALLEAEAGTTVRRDTAAVPGDVPPELVPWDVLTRHYLGGEEATLDADPAVVLERLFETPLDAGEDGVEPSKGEDARPGAVTLRAVLDRPVGRRHGEPVTAWGLLHTPLSVADGPWTTLEAVFEAPLAATGDHTVTLRECFDRIESEERFDRREFEAVYLANVVHAPFEVLDGTVLEGDLGRTEAPVPERTLHDLMRTPIDLGSSRTVTFERVFDLPVEVYRDEAVTVGDLWIHDFRFGLRYTGAAPLDLLVQAGEALRPALVFGVEFAANHPDLVLDALLGVAGYLAGRRGSGEEAKEAESEPGDAADLAEDAAPGRDTGSTDGTGPAGEASLRPGEIDVVVVIGDRRIEYRGPAEAFAATVVGTEPLLADTASEL